MTWYIARSATRQEKRAITHLGEAGFNAYCPMATRWERIGLHQRRDKRQSALFPGYLFIEIEDGQFGAVEAVDGVSAVLRYTTTSGERSPRKVPADLVAALEIAEAAGEFDSTLQADKSGFQAGQRVKVLVGPWWGHIATIKGLDAKGRVSVLHTLFGRLVDASYDAKHLESAA